MFTEAYLQGAEDAAEMIFKVAMENGASEEKAYALAKLAASEAERKGMGLVERNWDRTKEQAGKARKYVGEQGSHVWEGAKKHPKKMLGGALAASAGGAFAKKKYDER